MNQDDHAQVRSALERSYDATLEALGDALGLKDCATEVHSRRVTAFSMAIARQMGLDKRVTSIIARGAFLHDIGKLAVPDAILRKPGKLTDEEVAIMRQHCDQGYRMIARIPYLAEAAEIIYSHHERYDGLGYPWGLKGNEIPLGARIVAVANTLDTIIFEQPYRAAQPVHMAELEILREAGRQFDPQVAAAFQQIPDHTWKDMASSLDKSRTQGEVDPAVNNQVDLLTGLFNNRRCFTDLTQELQNPSQSVAVIFGDLDHFKSVNDNYGPALGDFALLGVARLISEQCKAVTGVPYRTGGNHFTVILKGVGIQKATDFAERIRKDIEEFRDAREPEFKITISLGVAVASGKDKNGEKLFEGADGAQYAAKKQGGNRVVCAEA